MPETSPEELPPADEAPAHIEATAPPPEEETPLREGGTPESAETTHVSETQKEHNPVIDIHDAHQAASTWKDFFIHIATIVFGLLIAVGLEQLVEHIHHRIELTDARKALAIERKINIVRFSVENDEFHRFVPILQNNLALFVYLRQHPGKPAPPSVGALRWTTLDRGMANSAWAAAQHSGVVDSMPQSEARENASLYAHLDRLSQDMFDAQVAVAECTRFRIVDPDPAHLSPQQLDQEIDLVSKALFAYRNIASVMTNDHEAFPDFTPAPSRSEVRAITRAGTLSADDRGDAEAAQRELKTSRDYERSLDQNEAPE
jgi:hypothetical protein